MTDSDDLAAIAATEIQRLQRLGAIGDQGTAGPDEATPALAQGTAAAPMWSAGRWLGAVSKPANPGRVGGSITPWAVVIHTTDMLPEEWDALVTAWTERASDGACAHFLIGRDASDGVVQFVPIFRNANHAGGPGHGVFDTAAAKGIHPNLVSVGIELHCAGGVRLIQGQWRLVEDGVAHGLPLPASDVTPDPQRPGRGWHNVTPYQLERLGALRADLELVLAPLPAGAVSRSTVEAVPSWGAPKSARTVGHVSLDPANRSDPWPPTMAMLR